MDKFINNKLLQQDFSCLFCNNFIDKKSRINHKDNYLICPSCNDFFNNIRKI